jgi:transposase
MTKKNKYYNRSRISEVKFREIIKYFSLDLNAVQISKLTNLSRQSINKYLTAIRVRILKTCELNQLQSDPLVGQIEVDESYFGQRRVRGKRGRGARGKTIVFGLLKRGDNVYTEIVKKCDRATL